MSELEYWERRYSQGGDSGFGSIGQHREWKWYIIKGYEKDIDDVIDVGCGDLRFWEGRDCQKYTGIDISQTIIERNKLARPHWNFICANIRDFLSLKGKVVLCIDVLYHIASTEDFVSTIQNLVKYTTDWLFIYTMISNPFFPKDTDGLYQFFRPLSLVRPILEKELILLAICRTPFDINSGFFIFRRKIGGT